jgi:succinoglycan biosynthesis protein ExoA
MNQSRRLLVVIPTWNEARHIAQVLDDLSVNPPQIPMRFVVADGGSSDGTQAIVEAIAAKRDDVILLNNPDRIQSAAVNLAVDMHGADAEFLARCDAHANYPPGFLSALIRSREESEADAVVVPMDSVGSSCLQRAIAWVSDSKVGSGGSAHRGGATSGFVDHGHHALFTVDSFRRAGGYDPTFSHNEDAELDCRQRALGSRIFLDAEIRLRYEPRATLAKLGRQYFNYGRGRSRTVRRHPNSLRARQLAIPLHVVLSLASLPLALIDLRFLAWPLLYTCILIFTSLSIAVDRRSICGLLAAPAALTMHFAWGVGFLNGLLTVRERRWRRVLDVQEPPR